jgi:hypothetical protein
LKNIKCLVINKKYTNNESKRNERRRSKIVPSRIPISLGKQSGQAVSKNYSSAIKASEDFEGANKVTEGGEQGSGGTLCEPEEK